MTKKLEFTIDFSIEIPEGTTLSFAETLRENVISEILNTTPGVSKKIRVMPKDKITEFETYVCKRFGLTRGDIQKVSRNSEIVRCRHTIIWFLRQYTSMSLASIANRYGQGHCNILSTVEKMQSYINTNKRVKEDMMEINNEIVPYFFNKKQLF